MIDLAESPEAAVEESPETLPDGELFAQLAKLIHERRRLDAELDSIKRQCGEFEEIALERMMESGIQNVKVDGLTLYIHRQLWAKCAVEDGEDSTTAYDRACNALVEAGLPEFVQRRFNVQSLSALFRERAKQQDWETPEDLLEDELRGVINVAEIYGLKSRKSG